MAVQKVLEGALTDFCTLYAFFAQIMQKILKWIIHNLLCYVKSESEDTQKHHIHVH